MKYVKGNLIEMAKEGNFGIIVHGCNCQTTMCSGIALSIKNEFPKAFLIDQVTTKGDKNKLGKFTQAYIDGKYNGRNYSFTLINAYTQYNYGSAGGQYVDYDALRDVFTQIKLLYDTNPHSPTRIGIPKIGAGRAGGDWGIIEKIIDEIGFSDITCVIFEGE